MARLSLTGFDANNKNIVNVADPAANTDGANKQYVDALIRGLSWKDEVKAASTANLTISAPGATIDGVTMVANDRFLAKDQSTASQNGIYVWTAAGTPATRALDADSTAELENAATFVAQGTVNADKAYVQTATVTTVDTTGQTWVQFGGSGGSTYIAGSGLAESPAGTFNIGTGTGISVTADNIAVDFSVVSRKFAADCVVTTNPQTFNHALASSDVAVEVIRNSDKAVVWADVTVTDANNISVNFGGAPTSAQYRVVVKA